MRNEVASACLDELIRLWREYLRCRNEYGEIEPPTNAAFDRYISYQNTVFSQLTREQKNEFYKVLGC